MRRHMKVPTAFVLATLAVTLLLLLALRDASASGMTFNVDTTSDDPTKQQCEAALDDCSLRGAINKSNLSAGEDTIVLGNNETYHLTVTGADEDFNLTGDLDILDSVTINGHGSTIDATGLGDRVIELYPQIQIGVVQFSNLTLTGGNETAEGGGGLKINNSGSGTDVQLTNVTISGNHTSGEGGGLEVSGDANVTITNSHISGDTADAAGGGLYLTNGSGSLHLANSTFTGNSGTFGGGMILAGASTVLIADTTVNGNTTTEDCGQSNCITGGGIYIDTHGSVEITGGHIIGNHAPHSGGGGIASGFPFSLDGTEVSGNTAGQDGGGIYAYTASISNATITSNSARGGGGLVQGGGNITHTVISDNNASTDGGGLLLAGTASIDHSEVSGNTAGETGGGIGLGGESPAITNTTISGNSANAGGGIGRSAGIFSTSAGEAQPQGNPIAGTAHVSFVTLAYNGAGGGASIFNDGVAGAIEVGSSIIAYGNGADNCNLGAIASTDYNVEEGTSCELNGAHDLSGADPLLGPLAGNGDETKTHALLAGSPAIDLIPAADCSATDDQRGVTRPHRGGCDAGAFESSLSASTTPTPSATPVSQQRIWGDIDCSNLIDGEDATAILAHVAGVGDAGPAGQPCPAVGDPVLVAGAAWPWGDNNCSGAVDPVDALYDLVFAALLTPAPVDLCPHVGDQVGIVPQ